MARSHHLARAAAPAAVLMLLFLLLLLLAFRVRRRRRRSRHWAPCTQMRSKVGAVCCGRPPQRTLHCPLRRASPPGHTLKLRLLLRSGCLQARGGAGASRPRRSRARFLLGPRLSSRLRRSRTPRWRPLLVARQGNRMLLHCGEQPASSAAQHPAAQRGRGGRGRERSREREVKRGQERSREVKRERHRHRHRHTHTCTNTHTLSHTHTLSLPKVRSEIDPSAVFDRALTVSME